MRNKMMEAMKMLSKFGIGIALIASALLILVGLRWVTGSKRDNGTGDAKRFQMPHEFEEKSMTEKEITEGIEGIPETDLPVSDSLETDSYFNTHESENTYPPTDSF
ncbi:hypothetical protein EHW66_16860 [Erwinia psidii]|uniref:hypothetical protein n=1 Tax=Erwinia psidii TaxID=69224 RepID=UPI00226BA353|nr:hypothetical protein [Erwinia psidii]MCX8966587.1 hypothetical protein [Erwinia psidii]